MSEVAERDSHILMRHRGAFEVRERALASGASAVEDYLGQFEGEDLLEVSLGIAVEAARAAARARKAQTATSFAKDAELSTLANLADNVEELRWIAGAAGVAEHMLDPTTVEAEE